MAARQPNGLTANEEMLLRHALRKAEALRPRYGYFGAGERAVIDMFVDDVRTRVDPASVEGLLIRAQAVLEPLASNHEWAREAFAGVE
jgi:hypothetical protein